MTLPANERAANALIRLLTTRTPVLTEQVALPNGNVDWTAVTHASKRMSSGERAVVQTAFDFGNERGIGATLAAVDPVLRAQIITVIVAAYLPELLAPELARAVAS